MAAVFHILAWQREPLEPELVLVLLLTGFQCQDAVRMADRQAARKRPSLVF